MATEVTELINVELRQSEPEALKMAAMAGKSYTGLAVLQGDRWVAISPELGSVAEGDSAVEALDHLEATVRDVLEIAAEEGLPTGEPVPLFEIERMIIEHRKGTGLPVTMRSLTVPTQGRS